MRSTSRPDPMSAMVTTKVLASVTSRQRMLGIWSGIGNFPLKILCLRYFRGDIVLPLKFSATMNEGVRKSPVP